MPLRKIIRELRQYWKNYLFQSLLASLTIFISLLLLNIKRNPVIIASIGATAFVVFAMPKDYTASFKNVLGGHLIGIFSGLVSSLIPHHNYLSTILIYSLAVGLSIFIMVISDTEHPPASGTALGIAISGFSLELVGILLGMVLIISLIRRIFKPYLKSLV